MRQWATPTRQEFEPIDFEVLEESALAGAQATIQNAIDAAGISRAEVARKMGRPRSFVSRMLTGSHNLTVKTLARALAACGFEVGFKADPIQWGWVSQAEPEQPVKETRTTEDRTLPLAA